MGLRIYGDTSGYVDINAPSVAGSASVTLPGSGTLALAYGQFAKSDSGSCVISKTGSVWVVV